jgi:hypothetical protein
VISVVVLELSRCAVGMVDVEVSTHPNKTGSSLRKETRENLFGVKVTEVEVSLEDVEEHDDISIMHN